MMNAVKNNKREDLADKLFNFRPVFFTAIFLCCGIIFSYMRICHDTSPWWVLVLFVVLSLPFLFCRTSRKFLITILAVLLSIFAFTLGQLLFAFQINDYQDTSLAQGEMQVVGRVVEMEEKDTYVKVVLDELTLSKNSEKGKLVAYLPLSFAENVKLSDKLLLVGKTTSEVELFNEYGFKAEQIHDDLRFTMNSVVSCVKVGHTFRLFSELRQRITECINFGMDEVSASVTIGLLLGDTSQIEFDLLENVRYGGVAHLFAVSGLHVGALYAFLVSLFKNKRLQYVNRLLRFLILFLILFTYAGACNFSASVVRAMIICLISYAGMLIGAKLDFLNTLGFAAIVVLIISPVSLFEIGFQLSFTACLGLALSSRPISKCLNKFFKPWIKERKPDSPLSVSQRFWRAGISYASACISAQIFTAPIQLYVFGYISVWSFALNMLFVPIVSVAFAFLLMLVVFASIVPISLSPIFLYMPSVVWSALLLLFQTLDFSALAIAGIRLTGGSMICYYGGIQFLSSRWNMKHKQSITLFVLCFLGFMISLCLNS